MLILQTQTGLWFTRPTPIVAVDRQECPPGSTPCMSTSTSWTPRADSGAHRWGEQQPITIASHPTTCHPLPKNYRPPTMVSEPPQRHHAIFSRRFWLQSLFFLKIVLNATNFCSVCSTKRIPEERI